MRTDKCGRPLGQWHRAFFLDRTAATHHRECQRNRGRITKMWRNGAGWEVRWREKKRQPKGEQS